jgi:hypothetical protein
MDVSELSDAVLVKDAVREDNDVKLASIDGDVAPDDDAYAEGDDEAERLSVAVDDELCEGLGLFDVETKGLFDAALDNVALGDGEFVAVKDALDDIIEDVDDEPELLRSADWVTDACGVLVGKDVALTDDVGVQDVTG